MFSPSLSPSGKTFWEDHGLTPSNYLLTTAPKSTTKASGSSSSATLERSPLLDAVSWVTNGGEKRAI